MILRPRLGSRALIVPTPRTWPRRLLFSTSTGPLPVPRLPDASLDTFTSKAFQPGLPFLLPKDSFRSLPAVSKWFTSDTVPNLAVEYLSRFANVNVPLEITSGDDFVQVYQPLLILLDNSQISQDNGPQIYLAQASLSDLPQELQADVPTPELVSRAGKGDIYDTSIWIGRVPTYTPLHRDPNPNLFVQLAGTKRVRMFSSSTGSAIFTHVQRQIGGAATATMRGEEMMQSKEREALEAAVWGDVDGQPWTSQALDCEVSAGDALFIPKGWWHSIKGVGKGMTGSVNWWFR